MIIMYSLIFVRANIKKMFLKIFNFPNLIFIKSSKNCFYIILFYLIILVLYDKRYKFQRFHNIILHHNQ